MKKNLLALPLVLLLTACSDPSVEDLIEDPELLGEIYQECQLKQMQGKDTNTEKCNNAKVAMQKMAKNMMKGMTKDIMKNFGR